MFFITGACFVVGMAVLDFVGTILLGLFTGNYRFGYTRWSLIASVIQFVIFGTTMGFIVTKFDWKSPGHAKRAMLRAGLCAACAYPIRDLTPEPDACTICPECGAAWRLESVESSKGATP